MPPVNLDDILRVCEALKPLGERFAFLGGSVLGLLVEDRAATPVRSTKDVDVVIKMETHRAYSRMEEKLRQAGFRHDTQEDAPICRWLADRRFVESLPGHVLGDSANQRRVPIILERLQRIAAAGA